MIFEEKILRLVVRTNQNWIIVGYPTMGEQKKKQQKYRRHYIQNMRMNKWKIRVCPPFTVCVKNDIKTLHRKSTCLDKICITYK